VDIDIADFVDAWPRSPLFIASTAPWLLTTRAPSIIRAALPSLGSNYETDGEIAVHATATVEAGAIVKGPAIIGPGAFVAASAYLRGGVYLDENCIVGPSCEVKTAFLFAGSKIAHLSFVGDSILGSDVNIEAGAILANYRNEMDDKCIRIVRAGRTIETGAEKFGALIGDRSRIGANAVIAPGALIDPDCRISRLAHIDQHPSRLN
jgi:UDP-N-acetylglucosamine diphosphorylase / glucose-1-phosphate thymidylyltransferase / UDP-N-acetylgalactosamine diphosphorylase / glucosamine-1-phosphate N-acetyltransferase / galactosamine-1-phosphate N-acetyltransferase